MNLPRWTCSRCGARVRHATHAGKPVPPPGWAGLAGSYLICASCRAKGPPAPDTDDRESYAYYESRCGPVTVIAEAAPQPVIRLSLNPEKRAGVVRALVADPAQSNKALGCEYGVNPKTVARIRRSLEEDGTIPHVKRHGGRRKAA